MKKLNKKEEVFKRELLNVLVEKGWLSRLDCFSLQDSESSLLVLNYYTVKICQEMEGLLKAKKKSYLSEFYKVAKSGILLESVAMHLKENQVLAS